MPDDSCEHPAASYCPVVIAVHITKATFSMTQTMWSQTAFVFWLVCFSIQECLKIWLKSPLTPSHYIDYFSFKIHIIRVAHFLQSNSHLLLYYHLINIFLSLQKLFFMLLHFPLCSSRYMIHSQKYQTLLCLGAFQNFLYLLWISFAHESCQAL